MKFINYRCTGQTFIFLIKLVMLPLEKLFCHKLEKSMQGSTYLSINQLIISKMFMEKRQMEERAGGLPGNGRDSQPDLF